MEIHNFIDFIFVKFVKKNFKRKLYNVGCTVSLKQPVWSYIFFYTFCSVIQYNPNSWTSVKEFVFDNEHNKKMKT